MKLYLLETGLRQRIYCGQRSHIFNEFLNLAKTYIRYEGKQSAENFIKLRKDKCKEKNGPNEFLNLNKNAPRGQIRINARKKMDQRLALKNVNIFDSTSSMGSPPMVVSTSKVPSRSSYNEEN